MWKKKLVVHNPKSQLIWINGNINGFHIYNATCNNKLLDQNHYFLEIRNKIINTLFWEDSWNQWPKLSQNEHLQTMKDSLTSRGYTLFSHYWDHFPYPSSQLQLWKPCANCVAPLTQNATHAISQELANWENYYSWRGGNFNMVLWPCCGHNHHPIKTCSGSIFEWAP